MIMDQKSVWTLKNVMLVVMVCATLVSGACNGKKEVEVDPKIVFEDMHAGAWMVIDNTSYPFIKDENGVLRNTPTAIKSTIGNPESAPKCDTVTQQWGQCAPDENGEFTRYDNDYRHGIVFQMGDVVHYEEGEQIPETHLFFGGVYVKHTDSQNGEIVETWLLPAYPTDETRFDWLDIRAKKKIEQERFPCVIDPLGAYLMVADPILVGSGCPNELSPNNYHCNRNRSVHADIRPERIVTYWPGENHYRMSLDKTDEILIPKPSQGEFAGPTHPIPDAGHEEIPAHVSYTFHLEDEVILDRWFEGCYQGRLEGIKEIRLLYHKSGFFHQGFPHPPMNGGRG